MIFNNLKSTHLLLSLSFATAFAQKKEILTLEKTTVSVKPRNVIYILSDDHRYDFFGFTGKVPWLQTPNLDKLALQGAYLQNSFCTTSLSSPSRASILTGLYAHQHEVVDNYEPVRRDLIFFPQYLQKAGYQTAFFGKWHMGHDTDEPQRGFNHWESFPGQGVYYNPTLNIDGKRVEYKDSTYITDLLTKHTIEWLKQRKKNQPFFVYLSHKAVHHEWVADNKHRGMYKNEPVPESKTMFQYISEKTTDPKRNEQKLGTDYYGENATPDWVKSRAYSWHGALLDKAEYEDIFRRYCETLTTLDESIGELMTYLKESGLDKETVVIYMGDNGHSMGEHGLMDKRHFYEESTRVPLIAYCPAIIKPQTKVEKMVLNVDIAPTILDLAGLKKPENMVGSSFVNLVEGKEVKDWRDKFFYEYYWEFQYPNTPTIFGVRTERYKYIFNQGIWDCNELYDLKNDREEAHNLIFNSTYDSIGISMKNELFQWLKSTGGDKIPMRKGPEKRSGEHRTNGMY
jgi:N-acetylglucosamine-6-sulfatase